MLNLKQRQDKFLKGLKPLLKSCGFSAKERAILGAVYVSPEPPKGNTEGPGGPTI